MSSTVADLSPVAKTLHEKSNQINTVISTLNAKIFALNLGVEAWVEVNDTGLCFEYDLNDQREKCRSRDLLGFAKCSEAFDPKAPKVPDPTWQLAVRRERTTYAYDVYNPQQGETEVCDHGYPRPLLSASRALRIEAMQHMEELLAALEQTAARMIATIDEAEAFADRL